MPRYVIHIGPHKTGTTFLQESFTSLHAILRKRGIVYPREWKVDPGPGYHGLHSA